MEFRTIRHNPSFRPYRRVMEKTYSIAGDFPTTLEMTTKMNYNKA